MDWKNSTGPAVGPLKITGYAATFTPADTTEGEDQEKTGDEDTNGSWTYKKFGDVTVVNTKLEITRLVRKKRMVPILTTATATLPLSIWNPSRWAALR